MMDQQETEQARELHRTLEFIGLRAHRRSLNLFTCRARQPVSDILRDARREENRIL